MRDSLHCSGKLVRLMLRSDSGKLVRLFGCVYLATVLAPKQRRTDAPYAMRLEIGGLHAFRDIFVRLIQIEIPVTQDGCLAFSENL